MGIQSNNWMGEKVMNRRSIFKSIAGAIAASAMEVCGWRFEQKQGILDLLHEEMQVNPNYITTPYEDLFWIHPDAVKKFIHQTEKNKQQCTPSSSS